MGDISYVVVSTPRSGTGWMHRALSAMGLVCGHETHFVYWLQRHGDPSRDGVWGDSSWLAAPFLGDLPKGVVAIHLVRNPLKSIASLVSLGHFDEWLPAKNPYKRFMQKHMPLEEAESWIPALYREIAGKLPEESAIKAAMSVDREYNTPAAARSRMSSGACFRRE